MMRNKNYYAKIYIVATLIMLVLLVLGFATSCGDLIERYFGSSIDDMGMDFFNSIAYVNGRQPYALFETLYPPLANLFYLCMWLLIPRSVSSAWKDSMTGLVADVCTANDPRAQQSVYLLFVLYTVAICVMLLIFAKTLLRNVPDRLRNPVAAAAVCNFGVLMAIDRGNIIILSLDFVLVFLCFYQSDNKWLKELALLSLAIAAGIKLYPAVFGVLLIKRKDWSAAVRTVCYGVMSVILPCFAFQEGLGGIPIWLRVTMGFSGSSFTEASVGNGLENMLLWLQQNVIDYIIALKGDSSFSAAAYLLAAILILVALRCKEDWKTLLSLILAMILVHSQYGYVYCFFVIPLLAFIRDEQIVDRSRMFYFIFLMLMVLPLPIYRIDNVPDIKMYLYWAAMVILCVATIATEIREDILRIRADRQRESD